MRRLLDVLDTISTIREDSWCLREAAEDRTRLCQPDLTGPALSGQELGAENFGPDPLYRNCPVLLPLSVFGLLKLGIFIKFLQRE